MMKNIVDVSKLPPVSTVTSKHTSIIKTDELMAYKEGWDLYHNFQTCGLWETSPLTGLQINDEFIGAAVNGQGYLWDIRRDRDCWKLTIRRNLSTLNWHGLKAALKMLTPDAEALYNEFYKQCYENNPTFPEYDMWVTIGSTEAMASGSDGCAIFYFHHNVREYKIPFSLKVIMLTFF